VWGVGVTADDVRGCYDPVLGDAMTMTPFYPVLVVFLSKLNSNLPSLFVEITSFKVPVFEITLLYRPDSFVSNKSNVYVNNVAYVKKCKKAASK